ncbi:HK97 family phage prohead protease [Terriglobus albidus]|uniref:HK97 family phage prohead protease n=1 Tax=Terriglobus albidus TaxID=1592106 RepID=UPI0021E009D1|nr:HK97 family phage prohead protease [Terriglobus albidus]
MDLGNDLIEPSAFSKTLSAGKKFPLLWQHDPSNPIGAVEASETPQGLMVKGQLLLELPTAKNAYALLKAASSKVSASDTTRSRTRWTGKFAASKNFDCGR